MEITQLRHFVAIADEMNFSRGATRIGVSQPTASRSLQGLERSLQVKLLERVGRNIRLTPAGAAFLAEARTTIRQIDNARNIAKRIHNGDTGELRIGLVPIGHHHGYQQCIRDFRKKWPNLKFSFEYMPNSMQADALHQSKTDIAFFYPPDAGLKNLSGFVIDRSTYMAAIPSAWPLAKRRRLRLQELAGYPFVIKSSDSPQPHHYHEKISACRSAGFMPNIVQEARDADCARSLVACEVGISFVPATETQPVVDGVTYVPIVDLPEYLFIEFAAAWSPKGISPALKAFIRAVQDWSRAKSRARQPR